MSSHRADSTPHSTGLRGAVRVLRGGPAQKRPAALLVIAVLIAAGFAAALGAGYTSAKPKYDSASTDLARGYTIVHINGVSGQTEATYRKALASAGQSLSIDQLPNGSVAVTNRTTRVVYIIDGASFALGRTLPGRAPGSSGNGSGSSPSGTSTGSPVPTSGAPSSPAVDGTPTVVVSGDTSWLVYLEGHQVFRLDPRSNAPTAGVDVGHPIAAAAAGDDGAVIVLGTDGTLVTVSADGKRREQNPGHAQGGALTRVGEHTYLVTTDGTVLRVDTGEIRKVASTGLNSDSPTVGSAGSKILQVDPTSGTLVIVDPVTEEPLRVPLGTTGRLGPPVEFNGRVYVPVYGPPHKLIVVDASTGKRIGTINVPGSSGSFTLKIDGGRLWANDQFDQRAVVIGPDGSDRTIDKGAGPGTTDSSKKPGQKPTQKPTQGPSQQTPGNRPPVTLPTPGGTPPASTPPRTGSPTSSPTNSGGPAPVQHVQVPTVRLGTPWRDACATIESVGRLKCNANPGGTDHDYPSGTVYAMTPPSGSAVDIDATISVSYVGQLKAPNEIDQEHQAACADVKDKGLSCKENTDPTPATTIDQYGKVSSQNPQGGADIDKGGDVTLTWRNKIPMPDFVSQATEANAACQTLRDQYHVTCQGVEGSPGLNGKTPGTVEKTDPAPGAVLTDGQSSVTITYYAGHGQLSDHRGPSFGDAQSACNAEGFSCQVQQGDGAPSADKINTVYAQDPGPGDYSFGTTVTLTFYSSAKNAPSEIGRPYAAQNDGTACNEIVAQGFQCNAVVAEGKRIQPNQVFAQDPAPNAPSSYGATITIYWTPATPSVGLDVSNPGAATSLLRTGGGGALGDVYTSSFPPNDANLPLRQIDMYQCPQGATCESGDHTYYSVPNNPKPGYVDVGFAFFTFNACPAGTKTLWRVWTDTIVNGKTDRNYSYYNDFGQTNTSENLGCVWA